MTALHNDGPRRWPALERAEAHLRALGEHQRATRAARLAATDQARQRVIAGEDEATVMAWLRGRLVEIDAPFDEAWSARKDAAA